MFLIMFEFCIPFICSYKHEKAIAIGEFPFALPCNKSCMICIQFKGIEFGFVAAWLYVNVCVEKTFQLSWLIIMLFSLSLVSRLLGLSRFLPHSIFRRHITVLIHNNNIDFNSKIYPLRWNLLLTRLDFIRPSNTMNRRFYSNELLDWRR